MARPTQPRPAESAKPLSYAEAQARATGTFRLVTDFTPQGDQPRAIEKLVDGLAEGRKDQVLLGVTGSGKTFTMAKVIEAINRPTLVLSHNKTLAAQLYQEFKSFFPENSVEYFVSYYDYYQPEAYIPADRHVHREGDLAQRGDRQAAAGGLQGALRAARRRSWSRRSRASTASAAPESYYDMLASPRDRATRQGMPALIARLVEMQYERTNLDLARGNFRVRGRRPRDPARLRGHGRPRRVLRRRDREDHARRTRSGARRCTGWTGSRSSRARST